MSDKEHKDEGDIRVTDKRRFTSDGKTKEPDASTEGPKPEQKQAETPKEQTEGKKLPPMDFATFILSLATSAQVHLGAIPNPATGKQEQNLSLAKETIDLLDILKDKTKGNLTSEEDRLFEHVLYDLRMMYLERSKK
jgi:hypothetical protein